MKDRSSNDTKTHQGGSLFAARNADESNGHLDEHDRFLDVPRSTDTSAALQRRPLSVQIDE
jgi:hypothetical protein